MTCSSCVNKIESNLMKLKGVQKAVVALTTQKGVITYDCDVISPRDIADKIIDLGFTADLVNNKDRGNHSYLNHRYVLNLIIYRYKYNLTITLKSDIIFCCLVKK